MANFHALLIGINYYGDNPHYNSLKGAVRDIDKVASYLENSLKISSTQIKRLTSPLPDEPDDLVKIRAKRQEIRPNYEKIVEAFQTLTKEAMKGDFVYIHYSGHGGRAKTIYPELESQGKGRYDEGIVPMDVGFHGNYLRDVEIATLLKRMTDKGLIVTLVFDSCHSGGATRGDTQIRGSRDGNPDLEDRPQDSLVASREELIKNWLELTQNTSEGSWLPNQNHYTFLGACRPTEFAYESVIDGNKDVHGALTYWMIDTLINSKSALTYQSLYNRIKGKIQSQFPNQLPILQGENQRQIFGELTQPKPYTLVIIKVSEDQREITLDAGLAAGLSDGTRLAIYPTDDVSDTAQQIAIAELTKEIEADKSKARILSEEEGGILVKEKIEAGASAIIITAPVNLRKKVLLFTGKKAGEQEEDLPFDLVNIQVPALDKVRQALQGNGWVIEVTGDEESDYQVAIDKEGNYEICAGMPIQNLHPFLSIYDSEAPKKVVERLIHLVKYQAVLELDNPASALTESIIFELLDGNKKPFSNPQNITLTSGESCYLKITNNYHQPLNVAVLDLEPTWAISQLPIQGDFSSYFPLDSGETALTRLRMGIPDNCQKSHETLKLFATKGLANFQWLILPSLDEPTQTRGSFLDQELVTRGQTQAIHPLNNLLSKIGSDVNNPPTLTREFVYESEPATEWITKDIVVTVKGGE